VTAGRAVLVNVVGAGGRIMLYLSLARESRPIAPAEGRPAVREARVVMLGQVVQVALAVLEAMSC
jgi:hypothetical protein